MQIEPWPIDSVIPYPGNPRRNQRAVSKVAQSLRDFGWQQPIVVDPGGVVVVGHTRLAAARRLGMTEVPVLVADLTEAQARAYRIADNRIPEGSKWDYAALGAELRSLREMGAELTMTALPAHEIEVLLSAEPWHPENGQKTASGGHRVVVTDGQLEVIQRAADALDPPAADLVEALVRICEAYTREP